MEKRQVYMVDFSIEPDLDYKTHTKVFASLLKAQKYAESIGSDIIKNKELIEEPTVYWEDTYTYVINVNKTEYLIEINPVSVDEDIEPLQVPEIEIENDTLKTENLELRNKLTRQASMNEAALCYLTMWDGGWKYTKDHVIECMHKAKSCLERNKEGEKALDELFEQWMVYRIEKEKK